MRIRFEINLLGLLLLVVLIMTIVGLLSPVNAADDGVSVCRDMSLETVRLEFHNIPAEWQQIGLWYLADGATFYGDVMVADALTDYEDNEVGITPGMALLGTTDNQHEIRGDANSPACEAAPAPETDPCPMVALNAATGQPYCYRPQANGIVPIPSAS